MIKGHNSGKKQSSVTWVKYDPLQVLEPITGRFHLNSLKLQEELLVVVVLLFNAHGKHLRSCRDGQLT